METENQKHFEIKKKKRKIISGLFRNQDYRRKTPKKLSKQTKNSFADYIIDKNL